MLLNTPFFFDFTVFKNLIGILSLAIRIKLVIREIGVSLGDLKVDIDRWNDRIVEVADAATIEKEAISFCKGV